MKTLNIQYQPHRVPGVDESQVRKLMSGIGSRANLVEDFDISEGIDEIRYLNFNFATDDLAGLWDCIEGELLESSEIGPELKKSTIIVCEGDAG